MGNFLVFLFLFVSTTIAAAESVITKKNDICSSDEQTIFFCKAEHKIAGVCASKSLSNSTGFAQYRVFDIGKNMIEFVFPEKPIPPGRNFIMETQPLPGGIDVEIKFSNNGFLYTIHERDAPVAEEGFEGFSEIIVKRDEEVIDSIKCLNDDSEVRRAGYESFFIED
ncbi:hypothetical protein KW849_07030 [Pseudomonas sp. PDM26]|uniref:hypothetical protein n=1 Tax=Pseudomonas sp. PDM26 TaxID=2854766 RepID=UPI001C459BBB|nr:hypothetical protein [Pseudomonas sp. PDM26]MBV7546056.1 hypothetical protein [Pseudomonas sp. PDM26]